MKKQGFSLAEVLMAIAILGTVALVTLPGLNANVQESQWSTSLKTTVLSLSDKIDAQMAIEDVHDVADLKACNAVTKEEFLKNLGRFLNFAPASESHNIYSFADGAKVKTFATKDMRLTHTGAILMLDDYAEVTNGCNPKMARAAGAAIYKYNAAFFVDVNGYKKPNRLGYDVFKYVLGNDGRLYPVGGKDVAVITGSDWSAGGECGCSRENEGYGCAGRVEEQGWKMSHLKEKAIPKTDSGSEGEENGGSDPV